MKKYFSILLCGLICAVSLNANEPKRPPIIGIEHALSEKMLSPEVKKSRFAFLQRNNSLLTIGESFDLGDGITLICDRNDRTGTLLEVNVTAEQWSELTSGAFFLPRLKQITNLVYSKLNDDFDFIIYVLNTPIDDEIKDQLGFYGLNSRVSSNVRGLGTGVHNITAEWGSSGKLMSAMYFPNYNAISAGPSLHEILHTWPAFICPTFDVGNKQYLAHWGISNADGQAGGFKYVRTVEENFGGVAGRTKYQASRDSKTNRDGSFKFGGFGVNGNKGNGLPYSDIELYLMGLKSDQELRDANFRLDIYSGNEYEAETFADGYFTSKKIKSYTIDDIITRNGKRVPDASVSQKEFKVLTVVLTAENAIDNYKNDIMKDIRWLAGDVKDATYPKLYNFRQATGNRGSLIVNNLMNSLKDPIIINSEEEEETVVEDVIIAMPGDENDDIELTDVADIIVYPNPTDGIFTLEYEAQGSYIITISDSFGKILIRRTASEPKVQINLTGLPSGMYLLTIDEGSKKLSKKVIKN